MKFTYMNIHPKDTIIVSGWSVGPYGGTLKVVVKLVAEKYFIDTDDNKYSYDVIDKIIPYINND